MVLTVSFVLFPAIGLFVTVTCRIIISQAWHQRRDARTTRLRRPRWLRSSARSRRVHRIPRPTLVTIAKRPFRGCGMARDMQVICAIDQRRVLRPIGTTGKSPAARQLNNLSKNAVADRLREAIRKATGLDRFVVSLLAMTEQASSLHERSDMRGY
jgi:hypothetical protein